MFPDDEIMDDVCALPLVRRVASLLNLDPLSYRESMPLPRGWHFLLFTALERSSELDRDGYPEVLPADFVQPTRTMLGGRRAGFIGDIPIGAHLQRRRRVISVNEKNGRSGKIKIVTREHRIFAEDAASPSIVEEEDMIQREAQNIPGESALPPARPSLKKADYKKKFVPDEVLLFRYSAVTFNAHRIHYDYPYATAEEGYEGLVVNGGLTSLFLLQMFRDLSASEAMSISTRIVRPLFCRKVAMLNAQHNGSEWRLWAENDRGELSVEMVVT